MSVLVGVIVGACPRLVHGAEPVARASQLLSDDAALRGFIKVRQPRFQELDARNREAMAASNDVRLLPNPTLTLGLAGVTFGSRNPPGLSFFETQNYQVTLAQTVEIGKRAHRIRSAELHARAVEFNSEYDKAVLLADARESLAKLVYLSARRRVLEERLLAARGIVELDQVRLDRGDVSGIDHKRLMLDVVNVERELAENADADAAAHSDCSAVLGASCEADIVIEQLDNAISAPPPAASQFEPAKRPDVKARRTEVQAQQEQAILFENRAVPDPLIGISYLHDNLTVAGNQPHTFGVFVSMPLPVSDRGQHQRAQALARADQFSAEARSFERAASSEAAYLANAERVFADKLTMLKDRALPLGVSVLDSTEKAYRLGQVSMTDLLLARRQRGELALDLVDTRYALFRIRNQIRRVLGLDVGGGAQP
jgi:outer membrane protein, heavy metal efflux system